MPEAVVIVDYDSDWPARYERLRQVLASALVELAVQVEHVGSTSVSGLGAKSTIDIVVRLRVSSDLAKAITLLERIGYVHEGDFGIPGREAFATPPGYSTHDHHLYVCQPDSRGFDDQVAFRDFLRTHPERARAYEALKRELAGRYGTDRAGYANAKADFVAAVLRDAAAARTGP